MRQILGVGEIQDTSSWFGDGSVHYVHRGRTAIRHACKLLGLRSGDEVLAPSYNCGSEIDALLNSGASVVLYRVDRSCNIDLDDLCRRITHRTKAIYITHYFGFPQEVDKIRRICLQKGFYLIEDCALSLFSSDGMKKLGMTGDIAVFSFHKTLPVPDGGALVVNNPALSIKSWERRRPEFLTTLMDLIPLCKRGVLRWLSGKKLFGPLAWSMLGRGWLAFARCGKTNVGTFPEMPHDYYYTERMNDKSISKITKYILKTFDVGSIVRARCANFKLFLEILSGFHNIEPLFKELPPGVCPLYFPVIVSNRNELCAKLNEKFIGTIPWWAGYHRTISWDEYRDACFLKDNVLALPVHQDLNEEDIMFMADNVTSLVT
jgi:dTDP-4-amino-4,6-dideoxygalactose transaminase